MRLQSGVRWARSLAAKTEKIVCNFIGDFKVGDNMRVNANSLCRLSEMNDKGIFNKLMVVQAGSIVEAALDQIIYRAQNYTKEGVPNIGAEELKKIRGTKIERFNNIIQTMETHKLLEDLGADIYKDLHYFRKLRNRVHIQFDDEPEGLGRDDHHAFADKNVTWSLALCTKILRHLAERFPRPAALGVFAHDISIPTA
jgi:hypothetical protein